MARCGLLRLALVSAVLMCAFTQGIDKSCGETPRYTKNLASVVEKQLKAVYPTQEIPFMVRCEPGNMDRRVDVQHNCEQSQMDAIVANIKGSLPTSPPQPMYLVEVMICP